MTDLAGRVWCFGDHVDTDLILPGTAIALPPEDRAHHVLRAGRPGWAAQVRAGDIVVAGRNFGMGSNRPAARALRDLGIACLLAESMNGLFFRSCVNDALPALEIRGIRAAFEEGDEAMVTFESATVLNARTGSVLVGARWPGFALRILRAGGLIRQLEADGMIHPEGWQPG